MRLLTFNLKNSRDMKKDMGFGVRGLRRVNILIILIICSVSLSTVGQTIKYDFHQGEVIDFDLIEKQSRSNYSHQQTSIKTRKYRFIVDTVANNNFSMTMYIKGSFTNDSWTQSNRIVRSSYSSSFEQRPGVISNLADIEINNPISFVLDSMGSILEMKNLDALLSSVLAEVRRSPEIRTRLNYERLKVRYGPDYYKWIIHEFFPSIPGELQDTIKLFSETRTQTRVNIWNSYNNLPDPNNQIKLKRVYKGTPDGANLNKETEMFLTWGKNFCYPERIVYNGLLPDEFANKIVLDDRTKSPTSDKNIVINNQTNFLTDDLNQQHIEIVKTGSFFIHNSPGRISGSFKNFANQEIIACVPGDGITKTKIPIEVSSDGNFSIRLAPDQPTGLVEIYFNKNLETRSFLPGNPRQVRLFVQQGDEISFSVDLNDLSSLVFVGHSAVDQYFLNSLLKISAPGTVNLTKQAILDNSKSLTLQKNTISNKLCSIMEIENQYTLLSNQLQEIRSTRFINKTISKEDSLLKFVKYLGNPDGYKSEAYKNFLCDFVDANSAAATTSLFQKGPGGALFNLATAFLDGWDLYWYLANLTEYELSFFHYASGEDYVRRFTQMYPGTDFQNQLNAHLQRIKKGQIGSEVPDLKFEDLSGKSYNTKNFRGDFWAFIKIGNSSSGINYYFHVANSLQSRFPGRVNIIVSSPKSSEKQLISYKSFCKGDNFIILSNSTKNQAIRNYLTNLPGGIIGVDGDNRIASDGIDQFESLLSWPPNRTPSPRTINLTTFWYSLAGAFVLTIIIVLSIRIRAKRREARLNMKRRMAQLEVDAVRSRMNPHFLFNALSSIQNLVNRNQIEEANLYLARFGELVRTILSQSSKPAIGLNEEIDMIRNYLQLEQLRFPFTFDIQIDPELDLFAIEVPPLLIQPHAENAVMHGISALGTKGMIRINFRQEENQLICEVTDNGPGYHPDENRGTNGLGQGWKLTRQRILLLKEQLGQEISAEVRNLAATDGAREDSSGTTVIFRLPIQQTTL